MFTPVRTVAPAVLVTTDEAKAQLHRIDTDDDAVIDALIAAATAKLDGYFGVLTRALVTQTWRQDYVEFSDRMSLPIGPVQSISSVKYYDADDVEQTLASSVYRLLNDELGPYVARALDQSWPSVGSRTAPISITFVAGYGAASSVPAALKQAVIVDVQRMYDPLSDAEQAQHQQTYDALISPYRPMHI